MEGSFISSDLIPPFEGRRKQIRMNVSRLHSAVTFSSCPVTAHRRWVVSAILCTTVICTVIGATEHTSAAGAQGSSAATTGGVKGGLSRGWGLEEPLRTYADFNGGRRKKDD